MNALAALANGVWLASNLPAWHRYRRALAQPAETQRHILEIFLRSNAGTAYGQAHEFAAIRDYEQFRERVPIATYDDLAPWIERIRRGESAVLTHDPVTRLVPTSGSSGGRKLIPFTASLQGEFNAAIGPWIVDLTRQDPALPFGPAYWSISPAIPDDPGESSAVPIGFDDDSAYLGGFRQRLAEVTFAVPSALRQIEDIETFRYATLLCLLRQPDLRLISVWHPSFLTLLFDTLTQCWNELLDDLRTGRCRRAQGSPASVRHALNNAPQVIRATRLRRFDPTDIAAIWPHLRTVSCWGDAQAVWALEGLRKRIPNVKIQTKGLLATEAVVSIPFRGRHPLAITSHFFEFADEDGEIRCAHELSSGKTYAVIVTTGGGLWRYRLGDLVEVDGFVDATPSLRFIGREGRGSDLCGEKLTESFVTTAIAAAGRACHFAPGFALLAPTRNSSDGWSYTLFVEGSPPAALAGHLDEELRHNPHYALCQHLGQLGPVELFAIAGRAYESYCEALLRTGARLGEIKPQSLSANPAWVCHFTRG